MSNWWDNAPVAEAPAAGNSEWWKAAPETPIDLARKHEEQAQMTQFARKRLGTTKVGSLAVGGLGTLAAKALGQEDALNANALATAVGLGTSVAAPAARNWYQHDLADSLNRFGNAYEQAASERDQGGSIPPILARGVRGAAKTLPTTIVAGHLMGPYGAIGTAALQERDQAITEGRDMGMTEPQVQVYAATQGVVEGAVSAAFQKIGLGGLETAVTRQTASKALLPAVKQALKDSFQELPEENLTEIGHSVTRAVLAGDWNAISPKELWNTIKETTVQTLVTMGLAESPNVSQAGVAGNARGQRLAQLKEIRSKGFVSAEDAQAAGIPGENRKERRSNTDSEIKQLEQEIQNEVPPEEAQAPEVRQASSEQGQVPTVEAPPQEAQVPVDHEAIQAMLAAEKAVPTVPTPENINGRNQLPPALPRQPTEVLAQGPAEFVPSEKQAEATPESPWASETRKRLAAAPAFKGSVIETDENLGTAKVTRPDGRTTTIHLRADEELARIAQQKGRKPESVHGAYVFKTGKEGRLAEGNIYLRSDAGHRTLNHEIVHWLEDEGVIIPYEVAQQGGREGIAKAYGEWVESKHKPGPITTKLFQRVYDFLEPIFSAKAKLFKDIGKRGTESVPKPPESLPAAPQQELTSEPTKAVPVTPAEAPAAEKQVKRPVRKDEAVQEAPIPEAHHEAAKALGAEPSNIVPVYRGTGDKGASGLKATEGGAMGSGVYFYTSKKPAESHVTGKGRIIAGYVDKNDPAVHIGPEHEHVIGPGMTTPAGYRTVRVSDAARVFVPEGQLSPPVQPKEPVAKAEVIPPPPELAKAGITIKNTPTGWSVTGIPKEIADGLSIDYQGKRAGKGHFFRKDPTQALRDASGEIAKEAERDAAERAAGRSKTSIGYLEREEASAFEQVRSERLSAAKEEVQRRNDGVEELLAQGVSKEKRGEFKLKLLRAREKGDAATLRAFDTMVQYSKDHPELGLPADETKLFNLLSGESFKQDDSALLDDIDEQLSKEIADALSFDFGANEQVDEPAAKESKQTAIPGTEEAVAASETREEYQRQKQQPKPPKAKQKAFISGMGRDLPGQKTAFDVDGLDEPPAAGEAAVTTKEPKGPSPLQQSADKALTEAREAAKDFAKLVQGNRPNTGVSPEVIAGAARVILKYAHAGFKQFQVMIDDLKTSIGIPAVEKIQNFLELAWDKAQASGRFPGMEPRVKPVEKPADSETTSTKNAKTDEIRAKAGMEERPPVDPESVEEWQDKAKQRMKNPNYAPKLAEELAANPKALDPIEEAVMGRYLRDLENRRQAGEDVSDELRTAVVADERVGTVWGRTGVSRQTELAADFSVAGIVRQHLRSVNKPPSDEQMEKYSEMADRIAALEGELSDTQKQLAQAEIDKQIAEAKEAKPAPAKKGGKRAQLKQKASDAVAKFKDKWAALYQLGAVSNPKEDAKKWAEITTAAIDVVKAYGELGVDSFLELLSRIKSDIGKITSDQKDAFKEAWDQYRANSKTEAPETPDNASLGALARKLTRWAVESGITKRDEVVDAVHQELLDMGFEIERSDTMAAMSGYGDFRELSKDEVSVKVRGIKGELQQILKLEDMQAGQAPAKTGVERRVPTEEERQLIKRVNEAKKKGGYVVTDPARQLTTAMTTAKTAARNRIADLENAIAKRELIVAGQTKLVPDKELAALQQKRDLLQEEYRKIFPAKKTGMTDATKLKLVEKMLDRHIAELKADLAAGNLDSKAKGPGLSSPEIEANKLQLDLLKQAREQAREASPEYQAKEQAKQNARYKASLERQLALWQERLASGTIPEKSKPTPLDNEMLETKYQIELVKREVRASVEEAERASRSGVGKALGFGGDLLDLSQAIMTGYEMSAVLRQGAFYTLGMPRKSLEAIKDSVRAAVSRRADFALHDDLMKRPNHVDYMRGGLETTAADGPLSTREELIRSRLASWLSKQKGAAWAVPRWAAEGLLGGERAFRTFANTMRADLFDYMKSSIEASRPGTWSEDDAKIVGSASNVFSGRGNLPTSLSGVSSARILFAPRWVWSRGELLVGRPLWKGDTATRLAVGKVYVRAAMGFAAFQLIKHVLYSLLAGDDEEKKPQYEIDPRSTDFSKTKIGDTRIDSGAGLNQLIVLVARVATGEKKLASGKIVPIRGDDVPYGADDTFDIGARFLRSKLAPLPSGVIDWVVGENIVGEKATVGKIVGERVTPMTWRDIWEAEKELNVPQGTVAAIEAFFGEGVTTYGTRTKFRSSDEEGQKKMIFSAFGRMDVSRPKRKDFGSDEKFEAAVTKFEQDNESAANDLKSFGVTLDEMRTLLREYYLRPDSSGKRGSLREKDSGDLKDSYVKKQRALARVFAE